MALEFTFMVSEKEIQEQWAEQTSVENWIDMYKKLSDSYNNWEIDLELAEFIVKRVKEGYINKYRDENIPEVLRPLLINTNNDNLREKNEKNKNIKLSQVAGVHELEAIKALREYNTLDYEAGVNLFCDGYDLAKYGSEDQESEPIDLSEVSKEDLLKELANRL